MPKYLKYLRCNLKNKNSETCCSKKEKKETCRISIILPYTNSKINDWGLLQG